MRSDVTVEIVRELRRRWRLILFVAGLCASLSFVGSVFLWGYRSKATFAVGRPQGANKAGQFAAQLGLLAGISSSGDPVEFYTRLLESRSFLRGVVAKPVSYRGDSVFSYFDSFGIPGDSSQPSALVLAAEDLSGRLNASVDPIAGTVSISVRASSGALAEAVLGRVVEEVAAFNIQRRQYSSRSERVFAEERLTALRAELGAAEDKLTDFLATNRRLEGSPVLAARQRRLNDEVARLRAVLTTVEQGYEQARIEEVRDTPSITIIDSAELSSKRLVEPVPAILLGTAVGVLLGIFAVIVSWGLIVLRSGVGNSAKTEDDA